MRFRGPGSLRAPAGIALHSSTPSVGLGGPMEENAHTTYCHSSRHPRPSSGQFPPSRACNFDFGANFTEWILAIGFDVDCLPVSSWCQTPVLLATVSGRGEITFIIRLGFPSATFASATPSLNSGRLMANSQFDIPHNATSSLGSETRHQMPGSTNTQFPLIIPTHGSLHFRYQDFLPHFSKLLVLRSHIAVNLFCLASY